MAFYRDYQNRYVLPRFGAMKLSDITREAIKQWRSELVLKNLSANTIRLATASLRTVLSSAVEGGHIEKNQALKLGTVRSRTPQREPQSMEPAEVKAFLEAARDYSATYFPLFLISVGAGLRQGEVLALKWGDLQFGAGRHINVQRRWYRGTFDIPKGNRSRKVNMAPMLNALLLELRDKTVTQATSEGRTSIAGDLLFPGETKERPVSVRALVENYFEPILAKAKLRQFTSHDLRHTYGSLLIESGAPLPYVAEQMGHARYRSRRTYTRTFSIAS